MKKTTIYYLFLALFATYACGRGEGEAEVKPVETQRTETVAENATKKDSIPAKNETPCTKDSTLIPFEKVDIAMGVIRELAPKDKSKPYDYAIPLTPFYIIINSADSEVYKKLVTQDGKPIPIIDFEKKSLVVAGFINVNGGFIENQKLTQVCKEGKLECNILVNQVVAPAAFTPINFSFVIPKIKENTQINFKIGY
jgi:hypothetical protein